MTYEMFIAEPKRKRCANVSKSRINYLYLAAA
jgi:hypothetical protein